jgi:signal peptidase II
MKKAAKTQNPPFTTGKRITVVSVVLVLSIALDQYSKSIAQAYLRGRGMSSYLGDFFRLEYSENSGAFLSLGASLPSSLRFLLLTVVVALFLVVALGFVIFNPKLSRVQTFGLSFVLGGGISNVADRLIRTDGRVIDFLNLGMGGLRTGIFNIADVGIMGGIAIYLFSYWQVERTRASIR